MNIEQLVSARFRGAELIPSDKVWKGIRRKLWWQQFLQFHPGQLNIFTIGGFLILGTAITLTLSVKGPSMEELALREEIPAALNEQVNQDLNKPAGDIIASTTIRDQKFEKQGPSDQETSEIAQSELPEVKSASHKEIPEGLSNYSPLDSDAGSPAAKLPLAPRPEARFTVSEASGCVPLLVKFENLSLHGNSFRWTFGDGGASTERDVEHLYREPGNYPVTLAIVNESGAGSTYQMNVEVYPGPGAAFKIEPVNNSSDRTGSYQVMNHSTSAFASSWNLLDERGNRIRGWSSNEFQPVLSRMDLKDASKMRLITMDERGCIDTVIREITSLIENSEPKLLFANAFSPNPTGPGGGTYSPHEKRIDIFHPVFVEAPQKYHLQIYTRRGELVFETRELYQGWDGYYQQERSATGVYVWMVEGTWGDGQEFREKGDVTLLWNDRRN